MFTVEPDTVKALYDAQQADLRGKIRLDVSSRTCPEDSSVPYEVELARTAVGERFLREIAGFVDGVMLLREDTESAMVPILRVKERRCEYPTQLTSRLCQAYGLDLNRSAEALDRLSSDFRRWLSSPDGEAAIASAKIETSLAHGQTEIRIRGYPYDPVEHLLGRRDAEIQPVEYLVIED